MFGRAFVEEQIRRFPIRDKLGESNLCRSNTPRPF
jgi:hypothetical protein